MSLHAESAGENTTQGDANSVKDKTESAVPAAPIPDGIVKMKDGTYIVHNGTATKVEKKTTIAEGPTVEASGAVTFADGKDMKLQEGQMVTLDGKILKAPSSLPMRGSLTGSSGGGETH